MGLTLLLGLLIAPMAQAQTGILGVVGDSISRATNADDDCSDAFECLENLGADWDFSFASGLQPWSLPQRLGAVGAVTAADDGARWDDALEQAQTVTARSGITDVIVTLGGNDACRKIGDPLPSYATLSNQMTGMLDHLVGTLPANGRITLVEVPDLLRLREVMADQPNVLFESCQGIWDLDGERLRPEAIEDVCDRVFGRLLCTTNDLTEAVKSLIASRLADERYVCENVLSSESTPAAREQAHTLTRQINHLIRQNARRRSGENGIDIRVADTVFKWDFEPQHVSKLDCFHPSRLGQEDLSTRVWEGMGSSSPLPQGLGVMTPSSGEFLLVDAYDTELRLTPAAPATGDQALSGDWNGDGLDGTGVYRPGSALFSLFSRLETGSVERRDVRFGPANISWIALTGDWDGDGIDDPGLYNPDTSRFFLYREQGPCPHLSLWTSPMGARGGGLERRRHGHHRRLQPGQTALLPAGQQCAGPIRSRAADGVVHRHQRIGAGRRLGRGRTRRHRPVSRRHRRLRVAQCLGRWRRRADSAIECHRGAESGGGRALAGSMTGRDGSR